MIILGQCDEESWPELFKLIDSGLSLTDLRVLYALYARLWRVNGFAGGTDGEDLWANVVFGISKKTLAAEARATVEEVVASLKVLEQRGCFERAEYPGGENPQKGWWDTYKFPYPSDAEVRRHNRELRERQHRHQLELARQREERRRKKEQKLRDA
jgi:hypothetical protein